jgi:DNA mismatch endonuclease (patch repair protein)
LIATDGAIRGHAVNVQIEGDGSLQVIGFSKIDLGLGLKVTVRKYRVRTGRRRVAPHRSHHLAMPPAAKKAPKVRKIKSARKAARKHKSASFHMVRKARAKYKPKSSSLETLIEGILLEEGINYKTQFAIGRCHSDFYLPDTKTVVEVQGCYWHGHAQCQVKELTKEQMKRRRKDGRRFTFFRNAGHKLLLLWECEIHKSPDENLYTY